MRKLYLDPFMDMCNGEILSYGIDRNHSAKNVMDALEQAIEITSDCSYRRTFHSDQGWAYSTNLTELPTVKSFITEDEVLESLSRGSGVDRGKERITKFFKENHTLQEKADFLKDEYGIGGRSHAVSGAMGSDEWHDAKGLKLQKNNCNDVFLTWSNVARHVRIKEKV